MADERNFRKTKLKEALEEAQFQSKMYSSTYYVYEDVDENSLPDGYRYLMTDEEYYSMKCVGMFNRGKEIELYDPKKYPKPKNPKEGHCANCNSDDIIYKGEPIKKGKSIYQEYECCFCESIGREKYTITFNKNEITE